MNSTSHKRLEMKVKLQHNFSVFLYQNNLIQTVPEATKLLKLVLTVPATTSSVERSFFALKRIKTCKTEEKRLSSLAIIAIEKERLQKLRQNKEDFYNNVDIFV